MPLNIDSKHKFKAKVFAALADSARLEILEFLRDGEKCVCEIIPHLSLVQPVVSRHLKILKDAGIVKDRKDGTKRLYSTTDSRVYRVIDNLTPELVNALSKEMFDHMTCR
jgi:DNA-binding transcriptional ArsR family regulator